MLRTIIKPSSQKINLSIPDEYIGKEVEILVFPVNNMADSEDRQTRKQKAFQNFMKYKGVLPADFDYNSELSEYRDERYGHIN